MTEVSKFISTSLHKQNHQTSLRTAIAVQNALYFTSYRYPVSYFYCSGIKGEHLVDLIMNLVDDEIISQKNVQNDPIYESVFLKCSI